MLALIINILFKKRFLVAGVSILTVIVVFSNLIPDYYKILQMKSDFAKTKARLSASTEKLLNTKPLMIVAQPYDTHFKEAGLLFGNFFSCHL